jgi:hypothetical protein
MMEARMSDDLPQSGRQKEGNSGGVARNLLHLLAEIGATVTRYFWRRHPASDVVTAENRGRKAPEAQTSRIAHTALDDKEIQRRRDLVRTLFNDFWSEADDKPAAFVDRLAQAEPYINDRLTACGEFWQLDAETRITLGLPSMNKGANPRPS